MFTRLKDLREDNDLSQEDCANIAYINKMTYFNYENDKRQPTIDVLMIFASYYNTSIDYIMRMTDERKPYKRNIGTMKRINCSKK